MLLSPSLSHNCLNSSLPPRPVNPDDGPRVASSVLGRVPQCYLVVSSKGDPYTHMLIKLDGGPRATRQLRPSRRGSTGQAPPVPMPLRAVSLPRSPLPLVPMVPRALSSPASMPVPMPPWAVSPGVAGAGPMSTPAYMPGPLPPRAVAGSMDASIFMGVDAPEDDFLNGLFFDDFLEPYNKKVRV